jgi:alkylation response protein AidB-like acyl-CoA dehydrogenase
VTPQITHTPPPCPGAYDAGDLRERAAALAGWLASQADGEEGRSTRFPTKEFGWLAAEGWLAAPLPRRLGGLGLGTERGSTLALLQTLKEVGRGQLPVGRIYEGHVNALQLIQLFGTPEQIERYAADAGRHGRIFGVWNAEGKTGGLQFVAAGDGRWLGMERTVSGAVDFSGVEVGSETLIGPPDTYYREPWFNGGSIRFTSVQLGGAEAIYDCTRAFLRETGMADHPAQRARIAEMAVAIESGNLWLHGAAAMAERPPEDAPAITAYAGMARIAIEQICLDVIRGAERCVGARGLIRPWPFERMIRDLTMYLRQPAPDVIVERVGRHVLDDARPAIRQWS